jgi:hypothetical protein
LLPIGESRSDVYTLPSGRLVRWERAGDAVVDQETTLRFSVTDPDGTPALLEPYMGMLSHAAVSRDDGSVFVHLHPSGSISLAAQMRFEREESDGADERMPQTHAEGAVEPTNIVTFPFVYSDAGAYRIFVQVKVAGSVETAVFDLDVADV